MIDLLIKRYLSNQEDPKFTLLQLKNKPKIQLPSLQDNNKKGILRFMTHLRNSREQFLFIQISTLQCDLINIQSIILKYYLIWFIFFDHFSSKSTNFIWFLSFKIDADSFLLYLSYISLFSDFLLAIIFSSCWSAFSFYFSSVFSS